MNENSIKNVIIKFDSIKTQIIYNVEQSLLPIRFIYYKNNNIMVDCNERRCLPIYTEHQAIYRGTLESTINIENDLLDVVNKLVEKRLTKKQKLVLRKISQIETKMTMSFLAKKLSLELKVGKSTIRIILQTLRDVGLISCGSYDNKGKPVELTRIGRIVSKKLDGEKKNY